MLNRWFSLNITMEKWPIIDKDFLFSENSHMCWLLCLSKRLSKPQNELEIKSSPVSSPYPASSLSPAQTEVAPPQAQTEPLAGVHTAPDTDRATTQCVLHPQHRQKLWSLCTLYPAQTQLSPASALPLAQVRAAGTTWCAEPQVTGPHCKCTATGTYGTIPP